MAARELNAAELQIRQIARDLGCFGGITYSTDFLRARGESFLTKCHQDDKELDLKLFATQFCEQIDQETGILFRDMLWPEVQRGKPAKRAWSTDRESIITLLVQLFRTQIEVRRIEVIEKRSKSDFGRWAACAELANSSGISIQASLEECNEYLETQKRLFDVEVVPGLDDQWVTEKKPLPNHAIFKIERFMHSFDLYTLRIDLGVVQAIESLVINLVSGTGLDFRTNDRSIYNRLAIRCLEQIIISTAMLLEKGFVIESTAICNASSTAQSLPEHPTPLESELEDHSEAMKKPWIRKRKTRGSINVQASSGADQEGSTSAVNMASAPHFIKAPNFLQAWIKYPVAKRYEGSINEAQQREILAEFSSEKTFTELIRLEYNKTKTQQRSIDGYQSLEDAADENVNRVLSQPPNKKKNTRTEVSKSMSWDSSGRDSPMFGTFFINTPMHTTSNLADRVEDNKSPYSTFQIMPAPVLKNNKKPMRFANTDTTTQHPILTLQQNANDKVEHRVSPAEEVIRPDRTVEIGLPSDTHRASSTDQSDLLETPAKTNADCTIATRPELVFTIQKVIGRQVMRSEPYDAHLLKEKTMEQFFSFFRAESGILQNTLKFRFPNYDEPRIITEGKPGAEKRFNRLKIDIDEALEEAKGKEQFKIEVTVPGVDYM